MWPDMSPGETSAHTFLSNARRKRRKGKRKSRRQEGGGRTDGGDVGGESRRENRRWGWRGRIKEGEQRGRREVTAREERMREGL